MAHKILHITIPRVELTATTVKGAIDELEANKVDKTLIVDNVTTDDATFKRLSAKQGKVLQVTQRTLTNKATNLRCK